jgi:putative ABC transport system permease protein
MRALGASRGQLGRAHLAEFMLVGALAGFIGAAGASALGYALASRVLHVDFSFSPWVWLAGMGLGALGIALAGRLGTRRVLTTPPLQVLREAA